MATLTNQQLMERWSRAQAKAHVRVEPGHPLEWWVGFDEVNQRTLLLISPLEPRSISSSKSIFVAMGLRTDGQWALSFKLMRAEQEDVFVRLCTDLIDSSRNFPDVRTALDFVLRRYEQWSKLMAHERAGLLTESQQRGLLGELHFMETMIRQGMPVQDAVLGWMGPEGADQDFVFEKGWHEVKTVGVSASEVSISSLQQLDQPTAGELVVVMIDGTGPGETQSITLNGKVEQVRSFLNVAPAALDGFDAKLLSCGYVDCPEYSQQWYRISGYRRYAIYAGFPRLVRATVPDEIVSVQYVLSLQALESWRIK